MVTCYGGEEGKDWNRLRIRWKELVWYFRGAHMSKWLAASGLAFALAIAACIGIGESPIRTTDLATACIVPEPKSNGSLLIENPVVDLGPIKQSVNHKFEFRNIGVRPIRIVKATPSCRCAVTAPDKEWLRGGETGFITLTATPRPDQPGRQAYAADIEYEDDATRHIRVMLYFQYHPDVVFPSRVKVCAAGDLPGEVTFTLTDYRPQPLQLKRITTSSTDVVATLVRRSETYRPGWDYQLRVTAHPKDRAAGQYEESVVIETSDPERPTLSVLVSVEKSLRLRVAPTNLFLRRDHAQPDRQVGRLVVDDSNGDPVDIESIDTSHEALTWGPITALGSRKLVQVCLNHPRWCTNPTPLTMRVRTSRPAAEEIAVRVVPDG